MKNKLYYMLDKKSNLEMNPFFAPNKDVALRSLAGQLRDIREKQLYTALAVWSDCDLIELDLDKMSKQVITEYENFFPKESVKNDKN